FARMGYAEAAREQAVVIPSTATRFETEIQLRMTLAHLELDRAEVAIADRMIGEAENFLHRGIDCGAIVDPWNILGFQGQFPLFAAREDSVSDQRVDKLLAMMEQAFNAYSRLVCEAAAAGDDGLCRTAAGRFRRLAEFWDKFATTSVSDLPAIHGGESYESAVRVAEALSAWHREGVGDGNIAFWKRRIDDFQSPRAYAIVIDLLIRKKDIVAAMNLLIQWLSQSQSVPLEAGGYSFSPLMLRWLNLVLDGDRAAAWPLVRKFFEFFEANAGEWVAVPALVRGAAGELQLGGTSADRRSAGPFAADHNEPGPGAFAAEEGPLIDPDEFVEESSSLYGAAYENVVYRDSAQDGQTGDTVDESGPHFDTDLDLIAGPVDARLRFLVTLSQTWGVVADYLSEGPANSGERAAGAQRLMVTDEQLGVLRHWEARNGQLIAGITALTDDLAAWEPAEPGGDPDSLSEYDRQLHVKFGLLNAVISAGVALTDTARMLKCLTHKEPSQAATKDFEETSLLLLRRLAEKNRAGVRRALPFLLRHLARRALLYVPVDRGGRPKDILAARNLQSLIRTLLAQMPQLGLFRETWHLLRIAYVMERTSPPTGMSITEFDRLLEAALHATLASIISAQTPDGRPLDDQALVDTTGQVLELYLRLWLKHSATMRLSSVEALKDPPTWRKVKSFIKKYGADLFHPRMLTMGNLRGIVQRGAEAYLDYLSENEDPLHPVKLLEELDSKMSRGSAAFLLDTILRCIVEKFDRFLEYNTTTTQSDYGEQLYCLLDFLRHEADYERQAWNLAPMELAHEVLSRMGRRTAAEWWRDDLERKTAEIAKSFLQKLKRLEKQYGMRLPGISDRLAERFVKPLALDRILALVKPAMRDARAGADSEAFRRLNRESEEYLSTTLGSALELQPWLQALEEEVQQAEAETAAPSDQDSDDAQAARLSIDLETLQQQLNVWEKPLVDPDEGIWPLKDK
ncbi:MAG TPA: hypothetical protein VKU82_08700, partial [Planctomycetaceae bacterium]|nr:hypothetical protein [Planctomycetaceae bacterium]